MAAGDDKRSPSAEYAVAMDAMVERLKAIRDEAPNVPMFMGWPDSWWEAHQWRCPNDHVSIRVLKSEALGRDACLACQAPVRLTFPEDEDGPLRSPHSDGYPASGGAS